MKTVVRVAAMSLLLCTSFPTFASKLVTKPLVLTGILQEQVGPALRCPSQFGGMITGHGNSPATGPVAFVGTDCITPSGPVFNFTHGRFIIVAVNGEQIFANYSGQFVPTGDGSKFVFNNATFQITGGTGRYKHASGGGDFTGDEDMATGAGTIRLNGRITHKE